MVDFDKLRNKRDKAKPIDPLEIFRRLPKPPGLNDLYSSQAAVLEEWHSLREENDLVVKLHTGGGKTLVGLLIGQSILNETNKPVLYLTLTKQLVNQTIEKAKEIGIPAVQYPHDASKTINEQFLNAEAILVTTYKSLFNGRSKFGLRGRDKPVQAEAIILDDAHSAFSLIRESFTLNINNEDNKELYQTLTSLFRESFKYINKQGTFDDVISGKEYDILEVPFEAWYNKINSVQQILSENTTDNHNFVWPILRDNLKFCHALVSRNSFTITPVLPFINIFPTFDDAKRRIFMSATISDDSDIIRTFGTSKKSIEKIITSRTLAGISERMILIPQLMNFDFEDNITSLKRIIETFTKKNLGSIILVPSNRMAERWKDISADISETVDEAIAHLLDGKREHPVIFANRYDGIDLPGDSCRLLIMDGAPYGNSNYDYFKANTLYNSNLISHMVAQRIEQGMGRGARGSADYCLILLVGRELVAWVSKKTNYNFLTQATKAQLNIGIEVSSDVQDLEDFIHTIELCIKRDPSWVKYHAETLSEFVDNEEIIRQELIETAIVERKVFDLWQNNLTEDAIAKLIKFVDHPQSSLDSHNKGWLEQLIARMFYEIGNKEKADEYQRRAFFNNKNLFKPKSRIEYQVLENPGKQAKEICKHIEEYHQRLGFLSHFEEVVSYLNPQSSTNQFENSLKTLGEIVGFVSERHDVNGEGPDVLWLLTEKSALVIEAKSHKKEKNSLTKVDHGQLLVASEWFKKNYPHYECIKVSVHPTNSATVAAEANQSFALTFENLTNMVSETRALIEQLCTSPKNKEDLEYYCEQLLINSNLYPKKLIDTYLKPFKDC